jgi:tRNA:m(5)U-54 methyltransferase
VRARPTLLLAGQMSGVEGYVESAASGLLAGINAAALAKGETTSAPPRTTAIGALAYYASHANAAHYEPSNITFGILQPLPGAPRGKKQRNTALSARALDDLENWTSSRELVVRHAHHERERDIAHPEPVDQPPRSALRRSAVASAKAER